MCKQKHKTLNIKCMSTKWNYAIFKEDNRLGTYKTKGDAMLMLRIKYNDGKHYVQRIDKK